MLPSNAMVIPHHAHVMPCVSPVPLVATSPLPNANVGQEPQTVGAVEVVRVANMDSGAAAATAAAAVAAVEAVADLPVPPPVYVEMTESETAVTHCDSPSSAGTDADITADLLPDMLPVLFTSIPPAVSAEDQLPSTGRGRTAPTADAIAASSKPLSPYAFRPTSVPRLIIGSSMVDRDRDRDRDASPDTTVKSPTPGLLRLARTAHIYGAFVKPMGTTASTGVSTASADTASREVTASLPPLAAKDVDTTGRSASAELEDATLDGLVLEDVDDSSGGRWWEELPD
jgi:hypothetical protein